MAYHRRRLDWRMAIMVVWWWNRDEAGRSLTFWSGRSVGWPSVWSHWPISSSTDEATRHGASPWPVNKLARQRLRDAVRLYRVASLWAAVEGAASASMLNCWCFGCPFSAGIPLKLRGDYYGLKSLCLRRFNLSSLS